MAEFNFSVNGGKSIRLKTAGKYCDRDIVVTAIGEGGGGSEVPRAFFFGKGGGNTLTASLGGEVNLYKLSDAMPTAEDWQNCVVAVNINEYGWMVAPITDVVGENGEISAGCGLLTSCNIIAVATVPEYNEEYKFGPGTMIVADPSIDPETTFADGEGIYFFFR